MNERSSKITTASVCHYDIAGYALLIGVEAHPYWPEKRLHAGRNDVLAFWKVCRRLGFSPENIYVLTSPPLSPIDIIWAEQELRLELEPPTSIEEHDQRRDAIEKEVKAWFADKESPKVRLGEATYDAIFGAGEGSAVSWLATRHCESEHPATRLVTYSGHGAIDREGNLMLCPADVGRALERSISFKDLGERLKEVDENLTIVLDCCFAEARGRATGTKQILTLGSGSEQHKAVEEQLRIRGRVFCASGRSEPAYQALLTGYWYGAFTWALTTALEQWQYHTESGFKHSTISHTELLFRARMLLSALSFPQHPVLIDALGNLPVFNRGLIPSNDGPSSMPNQPRGSVQMDPGNKEVRLYTFREGSRELALVLVPNVPSPFSSYITGVEYWYNVSTTGPRTSLTITWEDFTWLEYGTNDLVLNFTMQRAPSWIEGAYLVEGSVDDAVVNRDDKLALKWKIRYVDGKFSGQIDWFSNARSNHVFAGSSSVVLNGNIESSVTLRYLANVLVQPV